jgi:hypothetical protein
VFQNFGQTNDRYGNQAGTIVTNFHVRDLVGATTDRELLDPLTALIRKQEIIQESLTWGVDGARVATATIRQRELPPIHSLVQQRPGRAVAILSSAAGVPAGGGSRGSDHRRRDRGHHLFLEALGGLAGLVPGGDLPGAAAGPGALGVGGAGVDQAAHLHQGDQGGSVFVRLLAAEQHLADGSPCPPGGRTAHRAGGHRDQTGHSPLAALPARRVG